MGDVHKTAQYNNALYASNSNFFVWNLITCLNSGIKCLCLKNKKSWESKDDALCVFGTRHVTKCYTKGLSCEKCNQRHHKPCAPMRSGNLQRKFYWQMQISVSPSKSKKVMAFLQTATVWMETHIKRQLTPLHGGCWRSFVRRYML